jgi:hypothetical protein
MKTVTPAEVDHAKSTRQHFIEGALRAREDMRKTGIHITLDEFSAWVDDVQNSPNAPMPVCHN